MQNTKNSPTPRKAASSAEDSRNISITIWIRSWKKLYGFFLNSVNIFAPEHTYAAKMDCTQINPFAVIYQKLNRNRIKNRTIEKPYRAVLILYDFKSIILKEM